MQKLRKNKQMDNDTLSIRNGITLLMDRHSLAKTCYKCECLQIRGKETQQIIQNTKRVFCQAHLTLIYHYYAW